MKRLTKNVREYLDKSRQSALAAVELYNKPGMEFRTGGYVVFMVIAWTSLFHAIFFKKGIKPFYSSGEGTGKRYEKVDGEHRHWELISCLKEYFKHDNPPIRKNLEFFIGLRNKIEHRNMSVLDPLIYGECQSMLFNYEDMLEKEFGTDLALSENLVMSLQFSRMVMKEKDKAVRTLIRTMSPTVKDYIETFRGKLPPEILRSNEYRFSVFLVPKIANRESAADFAVEFVHYDPNDPEQMEGLEKVTTLIKDRVVPVASHGLLKPSHVVSRVQRGVPFEFNMVHHTRAWQYFKIRPQGGDARPEKTDQKYCHYDEPHGDYLYTEAWVKKIIEALKDERGFTKVVGLAPKRAEG